MTGCSSCMLDCVFFRVCGSNFMHDVCFVIWQGHKYMWSSPVAVCTATEMRQAKNLLMRSLYMVMTGEFRCMHMNNTHRFVIGLCLFHAAKIASPHTHISTRSFHTYHAFRHYWLLTFCTTFTLISKPMRGRLQTARSTGDYVPALNTTTTTTTFSDLVLSWSSPGLGKSKPVLFIIVQNFPGKQNVIETVEAQHPRC